MYPGTTDYSLTDDLFNDNPYMFFSTAAGPAEDDVYGPPSDVLNVYGNGEPMMRAEAALSGNVLKGKGGGKHEHWYQRGDVHALAITAVGYLWVRAALKG
jgi:hypothetical protein